MEDNRRKSKYSCNKCGEISSSKEYHLTRCQYSIEGIDYVKCKLCDHKGLALYIHIKKHGLSKEEYEQEYGSIYSKNSLDNISERNSNIQKKSNYRNKLKTEGKTEELLEYNKKVGKKVSETVMLNDELREKRSENLSNLNKTDQFRKKASETAKITSSRKDVLEKRTHVLKMWRENNPEKFEQNIKKMHHFTSIPEKNLFELMKKNYPQYNFIRNYKMRRKSTFKVNRSGIKQIDIFSREYKIIIEFDGELHFRNIAKWNQLEKVRLKDNELNSLKDEYLIIRVSHDQYSYSRYNGGFSQQCLDRIKLIMEKITPGLHLIGDCYAKD